MHVIDMVEINFNLSQCLAFVGVLPNLARKFLMIVFFVSRKKYYLKILKEHQKSTSGEKRTLAVLSWIYVGLLFFSFFFLAYLIREY